MSSLRTSSNFNFDRVMSSSLMWACLTAAKHSQSSYLPICTPYAWLDMHTIVESNLISALLDPSFG